MSVTINTGELKFSVFGKGFENTRNDSGEGGVTYEKRIGYGAGTACLDNTNTYFWITQNQGQYPFNYLGKGRISDLEPVEITNIPTNRFTQLYHPSNIANNIGIAFQGFSGEAIDVYIFDLTTDEIFYQFSAPTSMISFPNTADCIKVGDDFYFSERGVSSANVYKLDPINETLTLTGSAWYSNGGAYGFVDSNTIYGYNSPVWFSDHAYRSGFGLTGSTQWGVTSQGYGSGAFGNCHETGLCGNGYIWLPSYINGAWRWGKYDGNNAPDFDTPSPITYFGEYTSSPLYDGTHVYYNDGRMKCAFHSRSYGMVLVDFTLQTMKTITDEYWVPLAINEKYIIARDRTVNNTDIFRYR